VFHKPQYGAQKDTTLHTQNIKRKNLLKQQLTNA